MFRPMRYQTPLPESKHRLYQYSTREGSLVRTDSHCLDAQCLIPQIKAVLDLDRWLILTISSISSSTQLCRCRTHHHDRTISPRGDVEVVRSPAFLVIPRDRLCTFSSPTVTFVLTHPVFWVSFGNPVVIFILSVFRSVGCFLVVFFLLVRHTTSSSFSPDSIPLPSIPS